MFFRPTAWVKNFIDRLRYSLHNVQAPKYASLLHSILCYMRLITIYHTEGNLSIPFSIFFDIFYAAPAEKLFSKKVKLGVDKSLALLYNASRSEENMDD